MFIKAKIYDFEKRGLSIGGSPPLLMEKYPT
jgi:hypothetical protein